MNLWTQHIHVHVCTYAHVCHHPTPDRKVRTWSEHKEVSCLYLSLCPVPVPDGSTHPFTRWNFYILQWASQDVDGDPSFPVTFYETLKKQILCSKLLVYKMNQIRSLPVPASVNVAFQRITLGQFYHHKINKRTTLWTDYSQVRQFCKPTSLSQAICLSVCVSRARKNDVSHAHFTQGTWTSRAGLIPTWSLSCLDVHFQCSSRLLRRTTVFLFYFCSGVLFASNSINWDTHWSRQDPPKRSFYL